MLRRFSLFAMAAALVVSSCSQGDDAASNETTTTTTVFYATTAADTTTTTVEPSPATAPSSPPTTATTTSTTVVVPEPPLFLFDMTRDEIEAASAPVLDVALTVAKSLESHDLEALKSGFVPDGYVIDPVVASLRPNLDGWYSVFEKLFTHVTTGDIYVNADGSARAGYGYGFYEGLVDDPPDPVFSMSHIHMDGDLAECIINRMDAEPLEVYPAETSDAIGFPQSREGPILNQAQTAQRFAATFEDAWGAGDVSRILGLYAADGGRNDAFAGLQGDRGATIAWLNALDRDYSEVTVDIESVQASALGPSAEYRLTLGDGDESCVMRMVSVWDLNDEDLVVRESIFYNPDTIFDCGWEPADT